MRVLFVCYGNTCRSVLAEHLASDEFQSCPEHTFESAGISPGRPSDARAALRALTDLGIAPSGHTPRAVRSLSLASYDFIVAIDSGVGDDLTNLGRSPDEVWDIPDPYGRPGEYAECARRIRGRVQRLWPLLTD
jgi:protein-tyrosine-phosphatase